MGIELIDVQMSVLGVAPGEKREPPGPEQSIETLDEYDIKRALVRCEPYKLEVNTPHCNHKLFDFCAGHERLAPCPIISPATALDFPSEAEQLDFFISNNAQMARIRPEMEGWIIADWLSDPLFQALEERRMPLFGALANASIEQYAQIGRRFPDLPLILAGVGYHLQHTLLPLMKNFKNIYLAIGNNFTVHWGIEQFCAEVGARRLLFGSNYPFSEYASAIAQLTYADIAPEQKQLIGSENFKKLAGEIRR